MSRPWGGIKQCYNAAVRLSVRPMPLAQNGAFCGYGYYSTLTGNPMLEVIPTGQRGRAASGSSQNWRGHIVSPSLERYLVVCAIPCFTGLWLHIGLL